MRIKFYKYQGCGNDFILLDQRIHPVPLTVSVIHFLCDRRFGIGADGLMELLPGDTLDFRMRYYNSDGNSSSFCGNGGRCIVQFAKDLGIVRESMAHFLFEENAYTAEFLVNNTIALRMQDVDGIKNQGTDMVLNTGSPHYVHFMENIDTLDLNSFAHKIRYSPQFPEGINVNIVDIKDDSTIEMRTYERGVEDETLSCGTGVTAAAISAHFSKRIHATKVNVITKGGNFQVEFCEDSARYSQIKLIGPALKVFEGTLELS